MRFYLVILFGFFLKSSYAQNIAGVINNYAAVTNIAGVNITVASAAGFAVGDQILVIQMQGATVVNANNNTFGNITAMGGAGIYEFKDITAIVGNAITVNSALVNTYNTTATGATQIVRVPKYCSATVTNTLNCTPWNGTIGGVLAFEAGTLTLNSDIDVSATGFRGGNFATSGFCCNNGSFAGAFNVNGGQKGESISRWIVGQDGMKGKQANGGGGSNCGNSGGGGGGNAGGGGLGGHEYNGCGVTNERGVGGLNLTPSFASLFLGGGGGGGFRDNGQVATAGAAGGGIVYIKANQIICNNRIVAASGGSVTIIANDEGSGGGGAGGTIFIECNNYVGNLTVNTNGGSGGRNNNTIFPGNCHGPGGGGGGGLFAFSGAVIPGGITYLTTGGPAGTVMNPASSCFNTTFGAAAGTNGSSLSNLPSPALPYSALPVTIAGNTTLCSGQQTTLTASSTATTVVTFTWNTGPTTPSVVLAPAVTTVYTVTASNVACTSTQTVAITVNTSPTINAVTNNGPVCLGTAINFTTNAAIAGITTYSWTGPNGFLSNVQNPSIPNAQPINSGSYTVTVTNTFPGGSCNATSITTVGIVPTGTVTATPNFTLCQGSSLNLVSNSNPAPTSYSWTGPGPFNSAQQNPTINNITPANAGVYNVTAYYTSPVTTLVCTSTAVSNVQIIGTSQINVTANPNNVCQNGNVTINSVAPAATSFSIVGPNNFASNLQNAPINNIQPSSAGIYFSTATFASGSVSCTATGSVLVNVVSVNPLIVTPTVSTCQPNNAQLLASSNGAAGYSWTGPNNFTSTAANPVLFSPMPNASGIYIVTASYNNGQLTCFNTNSVQLTIYPTLTFTLDAYKKMCYNTLLNVAGPTGATSYNWTSSTGFVSNSQNLTIPSIQPNQSGTYTLNVSLGPCVTTQQIQIDVLTPLAFTLTPPSRTICRGDSIALVAGSTGGSQNYAYVWTPGAFLGSPTGSLQYGHPTGTTIYNLAGYDIACPNYTVFHTFTVQVNQPPFPDLQLEKAQGCEPLCLFYNTKTQNEAAITTFDFGGSQIIQTDSFFYCLNEPGTYNLKISSLGKNGCKGVYDFPVPIIVWPKPHSDFSWSPEVITTSDNQVTFDPTFKYGPITSRNWMFSGTGIAGYDTSNLEHPQRVFETPGKYPIMLIQRTDKGCVDSVVKIIEVTDDMSVFIPNSFTPNGDGMNDVFNVKGLGFKPEGFSMELFDRWGHSMYFTKDVTKGWDGTVKGQVAQDGVYIYKIRAVGANGEGRKDYIGHVTLMK